MQKFFGPLPIRDLNGRFRITPARLAKSAVRRVRATCFASWLRVSAAVSSRSVIGSGAADVHLTTHGERLANVHVAIQSIAMGVVRPRAITLWLDPGDFQRKRPSALARMERRGLRVMSSGGEFGPHTKYWPAVKEGRTGPIVTADDDILYPRWWLNGLLGHAALTSADRPRTIICYRAYEIGLSKRGEIEPYRTWKFSVAGGAPTTFFTGVSGALYPPALADELRALGSAPFMASAPHADDVWLNWVALRASITVEVVRCSNSSFLSLPGSQVLALNHANVLEGGNDSQIAQLYSAADLLLLRDRGL